MDWFGDTFFIISIHAPLAGRDGLMILLMRAPPHFNPRAPCGARQFVNEDADWLQRFQPTRPLRGATVAVADAVDGFFISTHAPLAGRDRMQSRNRRRTLPISTHAPLAGRDCIDDTKDADTDISTHAPLAGRDRQAHERTTQGGYFNPRAPCGARRGACTLIGG